MKGKELNIPIILPDWVYCYLHKIKDRLSPSTKVNLLGDREVEWSFCAGRMPNGPGEALDFGCGGSNMGLVAAEKGFRVTAIDLKAMEFTYVHPNIRFLKGDLFHLSLPKNHFSLVINCSAVEHVGLVGRYGIIEERRDGDLEAMRLLLELMKPGGSVLLTIPCGQDALFLPFHRVYGERRLPDLINNFIVDHEEYWVKNVENRWVPCSKAEALSFKALSWKVYKLAEVPLRNVYALGCFVLRAP